MKYGMLMVLTLVLACTGCTTQALSRHTLTQGASPTDIRYQEVLDNLAMVAHDPSALPAYSSIFAGTAQITDTASLASTTTFGTPVQVVSPTYTRSVVGNWALDPINAPEKLEAIRCACRWVIYGFDFACQDSFGCQECIGLLATPEQAPYAGRHFGVLDRMQKLPQGWVHVGRHNDVPRNACYTASCGDTWVWVMHEDTKALADFSLVLQDIARVDINSPTILFIRLPPSEFIFPTCPTTLHCHIGDSEINPFANVIADVFVDPCFNLMPDIPYYRYRVENVGTDAALRSQINAAAVGLH